MAIDTDDILELNTKAQRNLSMDDLKEWYSEDELKELFYKKYDANSKELLCDARFKESFYALKEQRKKENKLFRWTPKEDTFLRANYMYLSDATMGLALNLPAYAVTLRRKVLKLIKGHITPIEVIVWCKRDSFEEDMKLHTLTKARPEIHDAIKVPKSNLDE